MEPRNRAFPKAKTPPSPAQSQYPDPSLTSAMATIGEARRMPPENARSIIRVANNSRDD